MWTGFWARRGLSSLIAYFNREGSQRFLQESPGLETHMCKPHGLKAPRGQKWPLTLHLFPTRRKRRINAGSLSSNLQQCIPGSWRESRGAFDTHTRGDYSSIWKQANSVTSTESHLVSPLGLQRGTIGSLQEVKGWCLTCFLSSSHLPRETPRPSSQVQHPPLPMFKFSWVTAMVPKVWSGDLRGPLRHFKLVCKIKVSFVITQTHFFWSLSFSYSQECPVKFPKATWRVIGQQIGCRNW